MSKSFTKRCLFEYLQSNSISISNRQDVINSLLDFIKKRSGVSDENELVKKLTNFAGNLLDRWNRNSKNHCRFITKNEKWLDTQFKIETEQGTYVE